MASVEVAFNGLSFSWTPVPCGQIRGDGLKYKYRLNSTNGNTICSNWTFSTNVTLRAGLTECTNYTFEVCASNEVGDGPWSTAVRTRTRMISKLLL